MKLPALSHYSFKKIATVSLVAITITGLAGLSSTVLQVAQAQIKDLQPTEHITLDAIPPRVGENGELTAAPGEVLQSTVKVRNSSNKPISIRSIAQDFIIDEDGETPIPIEEQVSQRWSLASWVSVTPEFQELAPNEVGQINVIINIPTDALPGGHYAMVTHQPANGTASSTEGGAIDIPESAAFVNQRVGSLFYLVVEGPINEEAFIRDLTLPKFTEFGPVPLALSVDNQSDIHIKPRISVEITNMFGNLVETIQLDEKNIFPLSSRNYEGVWDRMWGIGFYKATAVMSFGSTGQIVTAHQNFWLFPITLFWVAVILLLVVIVLTIAIRRHLHHRSNQDKNRVQELEQRLSELEQKNQNIDS
jgi:uncharacterized membrane protein